MTMVLPLAFAACTSEEFESYDNNVSLAQRTEIGQVDLTFGFGDAQTRWDAGLNEEVADVLGAALIDAPRTEPIKDPDNKGKWYSHYAVQSYISTNYPYTYNGERWTSPAKLVEGSYMFYAPYAENHQVRTAIKYAAPVVQNLEVKDGKVVEMSAVADMAENFKSPFYFGYKFFDATDDNRNLSVGLRHVFAYPKFTLKNTTGEDVTITRIVLQSNALNIPASGEFDNVAIAEAMNDDEKNWGADQSLNMQYHLTTASLLKSGETQVPTNLVRADLSEAVTIADDDEITFSIVMPAMEFAKDALTVYFVTESGQGYEFTNSTSTIELVPGRRYPAEDYNLDGKLRSAAGELLTKTIKEGEETKSVPYIVTSTQELINTIDATPSNLETPLELTIGGDIEFNEDVLTAIAENLSQPVIFKGAIDIVGSTDATKPMDINQKVVFDEATVSGNVKFNNGKVAYDEVTVKENAALEVAVIDATGANTKIVNNGTLTLKTAVEAVENNGTMNVETNGSFTTLSSKNEDLTQVVNINGGIANFSGDKIEGQWTVAKGATLNLKAAATLLNKSTLTVNGRLEGQALTIKDKLTVSGTLNVNVTVDGQVDNEATKDIDEEEKAIVDLKSGARVLKNISGAAAAAGSEMIRNVQIVEIGDAVGFIGTLINTNLLARYTYEGDVTDDTKINVPSEANVLVIDGNMTAKKYLQFNGTALDSLTITKNVEALTGAIFANMKANSAVNINGDLLFSNTFNVGSAATLRIKGTYNAAGGEALKGIALTTLNMGDVVMRGVSGGYEVNVLTTVVVNGTADLYRDGCGFVYDAKFDVRGNVYLAEGAVMQLGKESIINGNIEISGKGKVTNSWHANGADKCTVTIAGGKTVRNNVTWDLTSENINLKSEADKNGVQGKFISTVNMNGVDMTGNWRAWFTDPKNPW